MVPKNMAKGKGHERDNNPFDPRQVMWPLMAPWLSLGKEGVISWAKIAYMASGPTTWPVWAPFQAPSANFHISPENFF